MPNLPKAVRTLAALMLLRRWNPARKAPDSTMPAAARCAGGVLRPAVVLLALVLLSLWLQLGAATALAAPTPAEQAAERLRYGVILTNAPVETFTQQKRHEDLAATTLAQVAISAKLEIDAQPFPDEASALAALRAGKIDCVSLRMLEGTEMPDLLLTTPYLRSPLALLTRADAVESGKPLATIAVPARADLTAMAASEMPELKRVTFTTPRDAAEQLATGRVDGVMADPVALAYAAARLQPPLKLKVERQFTPTIVAVFAFASGHAPLRDRVQTALAGITRERSDQLRREWLTELGLTATEASGPDDSDLPTQSEGLKTLLEQLEKDTSLASSARDALKSAADRLLRREQDSASLKLELETLETLESTAEREAARIRQFGPGSDLELGFLSWRAELGAHPAPGELWSQAASVRDQIDALRKRPASSLQPQVASAGKRSSGRVAPIEPLDLAHFALELPAVPGYSARLMDAARLMERRRAALAAQIAVARRRSLQVRAQLLEIERRRQEDALALAERKLDYIESELGSALGARLDPLRDSARRVLAEPGLTPVRRTQAEAILALASEGDALARRLLELNREQDARADRLHQIRRSLENTHERLDVATQSTALGLILVSELERSLPPAEVKAALGQTQRELANVRLRLVALREEPRVGGTAAVGALSNVELIEALTGDSVPSDEQLAATRVRLGTAIETANVGLADTLVQIEALLLETQRANTELRDLIRQRLLWTPSHGPIRVGWFAQLLSRWDIHAPVTRSREAYDATAAWVGSKPWSALAAALFGFALIALRPHLWRGIAERRQPIRSVRTDRIGHTLVALACTAGLALPWAVVLLLSFLALGGGLNPSGTYQVLFGAIHAEFWVGLALGGIYYLAHERGAGQSHFRWDPERRERMRRVALVTALWLIPGYELLAASWYRGNLGALEFGNRALMMVSWLALSLVAWRVFSPGVLWFRAAEQGQRPQWVRRLLRLVATGTALSVSIYAALGYELTAAAIARSMTFTTAVLAMLTIGHALALRWIAIGAKRVAVEAALARREAQRGGTDNALAQAEREGEEIAEVSAQSRRLVDFLVTVAAVVLLLLVWSEMLPAVKRLGEIAMWQVNVEREGKTLLETVSVLDCLGALTAAVLMVVGLRTVPSMLDLVLRQRQGSDPGTRFAFAALTRYFIVLAGVLATFDLLGVRWGHLQWMAAALTVGLGFGLQEIFANFVSGLIVLFERKVRVGDLITVGSITGTVTSISTRASTLLDWDRREVMVPNKTLITEQLTNWTLTDTVTRIVLKVGVSYGSDPETVQRVLLQAADEKRHVLPQPAPESLFIGLGPSSMDFELRVFVQRVDERPAITSLLYHRITELLREAGITVAFPQLDLWVRSRGPAAADDAPAPGSPRP